MSKVCLYFVVYGFFTGGSTSPDAQPKSHCSSTLSSDREEESFECFGENDDIEYDDR